MKIETLLSDPKRARLLTRKLYERELSNFRRRHGWRYRLARWFDDHEGAVIWISFLALACTVAAITGALFAYFTN